MASSSYLLLLLLLPFINTAALNSPVDPPQRAPPETPLALILSYLGFQQLSMAIPSVSTVLSSPLSPPVTIFAPSDDSIRSCGFSCSPARLLLEHTVSGVFPFRRLSKLTFGTKLKTVIPNRCLTVTSTAANSTTATATAKILVEGVEITRPDLFNDGKIVIHGIQGFVDPLTASSCLSAGTPARSAECSTAIRMIDDAILRLRVRGYIFLAVGMRILAPELVGLQSMTVFALDVQYISPGYHVVPNQLLMHADLEKLPAGTTLPTLVRGRYLVVEQSNLSDPFGSGPRINYMSIKNPDFVFNSMIVVHTLFFPCPLRDEI